MSREKVVALERLQVLDAELDELAKAAEEFPARRAALEADVTKARGVADQERGRLADNERAHRNVATQLEDEKDKVKKWEQRLPQLKHPREFAALQREVENAKKTNLEAEDNMKRLDLEGAELKTSLRVKEADLAARESALALAVGGSHSQEAELREKIVHVTARREDAKGAVDAATLKAYEYLRKKRPGRAFVPVENGTCTGCRRRLPPQAMNRLYVAGTVEPCPSCNRLVYVPPTPEAASAP